MRLVVFDLDHTLVRTPLDLAAMARDMRTFIESARGPLPPREERYRVGELTAWCARHAPELSDRVWAIALDRERHAMAAATLEPGAGEAIAGARSAGFTAAVWTNNAREVALDALERFGVAASLDLVVTRDEMRRLKPDPDGWRVIAAHFGPVRDAVVVGDSWVDGLAADAAGVPFVAYRPRPGELERWRVTPVARLDDLLELPVWLAARAVAG